MSSIFSWAYRLSVYLRWRNVYSCDCSLRLITSDRTGLTFWADEGLKQERLVGLIVTTAHSSMAFVTHRPHAGREALLRVLFYI